MSDPTGQDSVPHPDELDSWFHLQGTRVEDDRILYVGESLVPEGALVEKLLPAFRERGYELRLARSGGDEDVLVARPVGTAPASEGFPWTNVVLLFATILTTLFVGATAWYYVPLQTVMANPLAVLQAWPFTAAVLGVLLTHEMGHYLVGRYHGVDVSLPYVIPFIVPFGTMGAVIRMRSRMPDRKTLFDIGVAGPLAGLVATVVVSVVGLSLDPVTVPQRVVDQGGQVIYFHNPPLLDLIARLLGEPTMYEDPRTSVHPVIIGGWIGMFFTLLNLLPVGQLDGGHMIRAMVGERQETVASLVPLALFGLAGYLHYVRGLGFNDSVGLWAFWGLFSAVIAFSGPANPLDESPLGWKRQAVGVFTFGLGALCFMAVPIEVVNAAPV